MRSQTTRSYTSTVDCRRDDVMSAVRRLENCIDDVSHWMLNADKTELLWAGSRHGPAVLGSTGPSLQLKTETVMASDQVSVLGVTMSSDLSLDKHIGNVCATCFYWLRQLKQVRRSLDVESAATLVHAFVTSRRHASTIAMSFSRSIQVYYRQAPASYECRCSRRHRHAEVYDRGLTNLLHDELHWLDVPERVQYKLCATVHPFL